MVCDEWKDSSQFVNQAIVLNTIDMKDKMTSKVELY